MEGIAIIISLFALAISSYAAWRRFKLKEPNIKVLWNSNFVLMSLTPDKKQFEAWIPILFVNYGDGDGAAVIKETRCYDHLSKETKCEFYRYDDKSPTKVVRLNQNSATTELLRVGPIHPKDLSIDSKSDFDELDFQYSFHIYFDKTALQRKKGRFGKDDKFISLVNDDSLNDFIMTLKLTKIDYKKLKNFKDMF